MIRHEQRWVICLSNGAIVDEVGDRETAYKRASDPGFRKMNDIWPGTLLAVKQVEHGFPFREVLK